MKSGNPIGWEHNSRFEDNTLWHGPEVWEHEVALLWQHFPTKPWQSQLKKNIALASRNQSSSLGPILSPKVRYNQLKCVMNPKILGHKLSCKTYHLVQFPWPLKESIMSFLFQWFFLGQGCMLVIPPTNAPNSPIFKSSLKLMGATLQCLEVHLVNGKLAGNSTIQRMLQVYTCNAHQSHYS